MSLEDSTDIETRFQRNTYIVMLVALTAGMVLGGRRMGLGVALGGVLSLFNKRWLEGSVRAILGAAAETQSGNVPPWTASKLILRYFIIAYVIGIAVWTGYFNPIGIGIGFASFVGGVMMEAVYQLYLFFKTRDNSNSANSE
ncbi:MAG: ATP synthase subunit I [Acidobacteria bacterium]|nr:ATP synthase subunit I [Acidobacteriota bacterium]MBK8315347.1 ATP synthase subunit I [Acidobacteriota bacterium]MBK9705704.1 ATP synthase subunit I [Acidobacteriota bacterium]